MKSEREMVIEALTKQARNEHNPDRLNEIADQLEIYGAYCEASRVRKQAKIEGQKVTTEA